jgi:hypothetical protein
VLNVRIGSCSARRTWSIQATPCKRTTSSLASVMLISERHFCMRDCKMYGFAISMYDGCGPTRSAREAAGAMTIEVSYAGAGRICVRLLVEVVTVGAMVSRFDGRE